MGLSLALFVFALQIMKEGAHPLRPLVEDNLQVHHVADGVGFGWLAASAILSGSPIAAMALTLQDAHVIDSLTAFGIINGSRIGAGTMVLLIGLLYTLRGADRRSGMSTGLLALLIAQTVQFPAVILGTIFLRSRLFNAINIQNLQNMTSVVDSVVDPATTGMARLLPDWWLLPVGVGLMLISFRLFDHAVPTDLIHADRVQSARLFRQPVFMFGLGAAITFITLSVSVSLGMLVPLVAREIIRREHIIPYIMGAGITTFVDTLAAAMLLRNHASVTIVAVEMVTITLISLVYILLLFRPYRRVVLGTADYLLEHPKALGIYLGAFVLVPVVLILI